MQRFSWIITFLVWFLCTLCAFWVTLNIPSIFTYNLICVLPSTAAYIDFFKFPVWNMSYRFIKVRNFLLFCVNAVFQHPYFLNQDFIFLFVKEEIFVLFTFDQDIKFRFKFKVKFFNKKFFSFHIPFWLLLFSTISKNPIHLNLPIKLSLYS